MFIAASSGSQALAAVVFDLAQIGRQAGSGQCSERRLSAADPPLRLAFPGFPAACGPCRSRQNSLSCAPCCAALSLRIIPINESAGRERPQEKAPPMTGILQNYLPLVVFIGVASLIGLALLIAPFLVAFQQPDPEKLSAYECGFNAFDDARMKFDVRFYLVAILFIIFDLEVAFLFPWAVAFGKLGATGFWSMLVFLAVLTVGFAYEWKKGALEWD
jgi:NADH-quinone oxidoreductase subunit A